MYARFSGKISMTDVQIFPPTCHILGPSPLLPTILYFWGTTSGALSLPSIYIRYKRFSWGAAPRSRSRFEKMLMGAPSRFTPGFTAKGIPPLRTPLFLLPGISIPLFVEEK